MKQREKIAGVWLLAAFAMFAGWGMRASATSTYAITATNVVMSASGVGLSQFTVTAIPVTGTLTVSCNYMGSSMMAKVPVCPMTPPVAYTVTAGGTMTGTIRFSSPTGAMPASKPVSGAALAAVLLLGLRRRRRFLAGLMVLLATGLVGITACGGSSNAMTPGTYPYSIAAVNSPAAGLGPSVATSTTIQVTVP